MFGFTLAVHVRRLFRHSTLSPDFQKKNSYLSVTYFLESHVQQTGAIQTDLYPPTAAGIAALSADEWLDGCDADPVMMNLLEGYDIPPSQITPDKTEEKSEFQNRKIDTSPPKV